MKKFLSLIVAMVCVGGVPAQVTLERCRQSARENYPLIKRYDLLSATTAYTLDNISKSWLPQVGASAQATYQSDVAALPSSLREMMSQLGGTSVKGLKRDQYRIGVDVSQLVYDGGEIAAGKAVAQLEGEVQQAQVDVDLYSIYQRVHDLYFGVLLLDEQLVLNANLQTLLSDSEKKLSSMYRNGTAAESDYLTVKAERLAVEQQAGDLESRRNSALRVLSVLCGIEVPAVEKPAMIEVGSVVSRPELRLIDEQQRLTEARERALDSALKPRISLFAQGYYGYPGYDMFHDMLKHTWTLNGIIGARVTWNIGALYTRKNDKARLATQRELLENSRETFLFNNTLQQIAQDEEIERYRRLMSGDDEIIEIRARVRRAAESKLAHGIIDVNDLLKEINNENTARVTRSTHEIEMLKQAYDKKITVDNQ